MTQAAECHPWTASDYRTLHEGHDLGETARRLGRGLDEVRRRAELDFDDWYRRHRCPGAPKRPDSLLRVADRLYHEDGHASFITEAELQDIVLRQAQRCFKNFDPDKGRPEFAVPKRFIHYFVRCLRRALKRARRSDRSRMYPLVGDVPVPGTRRSRGVVWARRLFRASLSRLDPEARRFVEGRFLEGRRIADLAAGLGRNTRTAYNQYAKSRLTGLIGAAIREMVTELGDERTAILVGLIEEDGLNEVAIAELLRLPREDIDRLLELGTRREATDAERAEVEAWLGA